MVILHALLHLRHPGHVKHTHTHTRECKGHFSFSEKTITRFTMRKKLWLSLNLLLMHCCLVLGESKVQEKAEATIPVATPSLPEGNTTFLGGTTWCIAHPLVSPFDLQIALDWACGLGQADCGPIRAGGPCFEPNTLVSHASFAFNRYYQQNGNNDIACNFGGTARLTQTDPSYEKCVYETSGPVKSSAPPSSSYKAKCIGWKFGVLILLFLYLRR